MNFSELFSMQNLFIILRPTVIFFILLVIGLLIRKIIFIELSGWAKRTKTETADVIIRAIRRPFIIWCIMLSLYITFDISRIPQGLLSVVGKILLALAIMSITLTLANVATGLIRMYSGKSAAAMPVTSLTQNITRIAIFGIGILIILNSLGISIMPILATLGIGGLAVALALQDTMSNLFSGVHITINKQIKIGDYVKLESGQEGYVTDINWRTTKIRMPDGNIALVPNGKLAQAIIINYYLPDKEVAISVSLGVHYDSDLEKVEKITYEVAKEIMKTVQGGVPGFEPSVRYNNFGDHSINFTVGLKAKEFSDQHLIRHEFIKCLHKRYSKEGVIIPYPIRAINYSQEKANQ